MNMIHAGAYAWILSQLSENPNRKIDMVGHSRGGYAVMEIARDLLTIGFNGQPVEVRYLGLYDPVDMAVFYGDAETISANVETAAVGPEKGTFYFMKK
jgi:esterase/lipase superfamily enzyme